MTDREIVKRMAQGIKPPPSPPGVWAGARPNEPNSPDEPTAAPQARAVADYEPFPLDALPGVVRDLAAATAAAVGCDPAFAALPALAVLGAAVGGALVANPKRGFNECPALWAVVVGDSGTAKSPAADPAARAADAVEDELADRHAKAFDRFRADVEAWQADPAGKDKPRPPAREYFRADNVTIERLIENLQTSPRGLLVMQDELAGWFGSFTRYRGKAGGSDANHWLGLFDGRSVTYQRRTGTPRDVRIRRGVVGVAGGIQPGVLREALADPAYVASGLSARLVFGWPPKRCPRWSEVELCQDVEGAFHRAVASLRALPFDGREPTKVGLDVGALTRFKKFTNANAARAEDLDGGPMAAALPKLTRIALRLALGHHCATHAAADSDPGQSAIGEPAMAAGIELAGWFSREAERVYAMLAETTEAGDARRLADFVRRKGGAVTPRELQRSNPGKYTSADVAEAALQALAAAGYGALDIVHSGPLGGRPSRRFILRPTGGSPDETSAGRAA